jgi:hypothetical protein
MNKLKTSFRCAWKILKLPFIFFLDLIEQNSYFMSIPMIIWGAYMYLEGTANLAGGSILIILHNPFIYPALGAFIIHQGLFMMIDRYIKTL